MSTAASRRYRKLLKTSTFHRVSGYGGSAACGLPWEEFAGATTRWQQTTCPRCLRDWAERHGGIRRTRTGQWSIGGRRYRTLRLALVSTGWA